MEMKFYHKLGEFDVSPFKERSCTCMTEIATQAAFQTWPPSELTCMKGKLVERWTSFTYEAL